MLGAFVETPQTLHEDHHEVAQFTGGHQSLWQAWNEVEGSLFLRKHGIDRLLVVQIPKAGGKQSAFTEGHPGRSLFEFQDEPAGFLVHVKNLEELRRCNRLDSAADDRLAVFLHRQGLTVRTADERLIGQ